CCLESGVELPFEAVRAAVGDAIQIVVHLVVRDGRRYVSEVLEVRGYDGDRRVYDVVPLYSLEKPTLSAVEGQDGPRATTGPRRARDGRRHGRRPAAGAAPRRRGGGRRDPSSGGAARRRARSRNGAVAGASARDRRAAESPALGAVVAGDRCDSDRVPGITQA